MLAYNIICSARINIFFKIFITFIYLVLICSLSIVEELFFDNSKICTKVIAQNRDFEIYKNYDAYSGRQDAGRTVSKLSLVDTFSSRNIIAAIEPNCFYCLH